MNEHGIHEDLAKIQSIHDWMTPMTLIELRNFLGLANFYRRFLLGFSNIAWSIGQVTKGGSKAKFSWSKPQQHTFEELKQCLCSTPILTLLDLQQPFDIDTDAPDYTVGAVLMSIQWHITVRHFQIQSPSTPPMISKCTPFSKPVTNGSITSLENKESSTLITSP